MLSKNLHRMFQPPSRCMTSGPSKASPAISTASFSKNRFPFSARTKLRPSNSLVRGPFDAFVIDENQRSLMPPRWPPKAYRSSGWSRSLLPGIMKERGTQLGSSRRTPSPAARASWIWERLVISERLEFLQPDVTNTDFPRALDFKADQATLLEHAGIVVDQNRHHVSVDQMSHGAPAGDDVQLVPVVDLDVSTQFVAISQGGQKARLLALLRSYNLAAPRSEEHTSELQS